MENTKNVYLIDTENISNVDWLNLITKLGTEDKAYICYTEHSGSCTLNQIHKILDVKDKLSFIKCNSGIKNALDFQLVSFLGSLIEREPTAKYVIVSNDLGFSCLEAFWLERQVCVVRKLPHELL